MRIGLDLDGVIVNSIPRWIDLLNRAYGPRYSLNRYPQEIYGDPELSAFCDVHEVDFCIGAPPIPGAVEALGSLRAGGHRLVVITARHRRLRGLTEAWLDYYGILVDALHFVENRPKLPVAQAEDLDFFVEDAPHNALALATGGMPVVLMDHPYNQAVQHPGIRRCATWSDITQVVLQAAG